MLKSYLESRETEVVDIMMTLFDDDYILEAYVKDYAKDYAKKYAKEYAKEVKFDTEKETAIRMIKTGKLSLQEIALYVPSLSLEELKELEAEVMKSA